MKASEIIKVTNNILADLKNGTFDPLKDEYYTFKTEHKSLYEIVISPDFNMEIFIQMMTLKNRLEAGEDSYKIDVELGQYMAERYIDPVVKKIEKK